MTSYAVVWRAVLLLAACPLLATAQLFCAHGDMGCVAAALIHDSRGGALAPKLWHQLADGGGGIINGVKLSAAECFAKSLEGDRNNRIAWASMGSLGGGTVNDVAFSAKEASRIATHLDDERILAETKRRQKERGRPM
jgi:hypothetical protein